MNWINNNGGTFIFLIVAGMVIVLALAIVIPATLYVRKESKKKN